MDSDKPLKDKLVLVVDDEPDILEVVGEILHMCMLHKAGDYDTALQHILSYKYDAVVLDIMGVNGFDLLRASVLRGFPTVMLTAHALSPESLKKSIRLGAVSFLPKERILDLPSCIEGVLTGRGKTPWRRFFEDLGVYFDKRFGPDWKEKDRFFKEFEEEVKKASES